MVVKGILYHSSCLFSVFVLFCFCFCFFCVTMVSISSSVCKCTRSDPRGKEGEETGKRMKWREKWNFSNFRFKPKRKIINVILSCKRPNAVNKSKKKKPKKQKTQNHHLIAIWRQKDHATVLLCVLQSIWKLFRWGICYLGCYSGNRQL